MKSLAEYFFMRHGFEKFHLEPATNKNILIGQLDRKYRDVALNALEEDSSASEGYKAVIYGDFGRGKTHEAHNILWEIGRRDLPIVARYVKCHEYKAKEPFASIFSSLILELGVEEVQRVSVEYERLAHKKQVTPIREVVASDELATAFKALAAPNLDIVRLAMQWLGGVPKVDTSLLGAGLSDSLSLSREFAAVLTGFAHMFKTIDKSVLVYLIDEAERLSLVTNTDTYWSWVGCLRSLTEISGVGFIFYVSAKSHDTIPNQLTWDEVHSRIGTQNYRELYGPGPDDLRQWVVELFQTVIRKGPLPAPHQDVVDPQTRDPEIPAPLHALAPMTEALEAYPFTPAALTRFITECVTQDLANRPREVLKRIQTYAKRCARLDTKLIDEAILDAVGADL